MWVKILFVLYLFALVYTVIKILLDTDSTPKTLAYLLLVFVFPVFGMVFYFSLGVNYRHRKSTSQGTAQHYELDHKYQKEIADHTDELLRSSRDEISHFEPLVHFLQKIGGEHLTQGQFSLLTNGEEKFPEVLKCMDQARHYIHMEYYAWENDQTGNQIKDILLKKIAQGVRVRVLYDDFASAKIKKNIARELKEAGAEIFPQIKVLLWQLANRLNHRDHRKIIIVDGTVGFVGGINISDRYDNSIDTGLYWRDTHVKITGPLVGSLQRHFVVSWNTSTPAKVEFGKDLFPGVVVAKSETHFAGQVVAGGPIYPKSNIMLSYFKIFTLAREKLFITNPYFIPSDSIMDALKQAALSGVDVRLLLPEKSDSKVVGAASRFYFSDLLGSGVRIFLYKKGFVHAKTVVADSLLSVVGTANMDIRSFDLNFEIMSVIYGKGFAHELENAFLKDLDECREVRLEDWKKRGFLERLVYSIARLISSLL